MDYVRLNRLEQQFAAAFETLSATLFQPQPSSMEACWWYKSAIHITLGEFSPVRARVATALEGEPFVQSALADEFMFNEATSPDCLLIASAMGNYYMWYGLYALLTEYASDADEWQWVLTSVQGDLAAMNGPSMRASAISLLTGREVPSCMSAGAFMTIDYARLAEATTLPSQVSIDGAEAVDVIIEHLPAPVSGALLLGTITSQYDATTHLSGLRQLHFKDRKFLNKQDMLALITVYRLLGHDVTLYDVATKQHLKAWANVRECIVEPNSMGYWRQDASAIVASYSEPRDGRHYPAPAIEDILQRDNCAIMYSRPTLMVVQWQRWRNPIPLQVRVNKPVQAHKFLVRAPYVTAPITFSARQVFQEVPTELKTHSGLPAPMPAVNKLTTAQHVSTGVRSLRVQDADLNMDTPLSQLISDTSLRHESSASHNLDLPSQHSLQSALPTQDKG
jgi:hypothetical protein